MITATAARIAVVTITLTANVSRPLTVTAADVAAAPPGTAYVTVMGDLDGGRVVSYTDEHGYPVQPSPPPVLLLAGAPRRLP